MLINEDEIVQESLRNKPSPVVSVGDRCFQKHFGKFFFFFFFLSFFLSFLIKLFLIINLFTLFEIALFDTYLAPQFVDNHRKR